MSCDVTTFEYFAVLFSMVVGLAVAKTLEGVLRIVQYRRTVKVSWPALLWTLAVLQWTIFFWWFTGYSLAGVEEWHFTTLLFVLLYSSALFLLLGLLYPHDIGPDTDLTAHFDENRQWFFSIFLGLGLLELTDMLIKRALGTSAVAGRGLTEYAAFMVMWIVGSAACLRPLARRTIVLVGVLMVLGGLYVWNHYAGVMGPSLTLDETFQWVWAVRFLTRNCCCPRRRRGHVW